MASRNNESVLKTVDCEKCGQRYVYELVRQPMFSRPKQSSAGLSITGKRPVDIWLARFYRLDTQEGVAPCPSCGWVQKAVFAQARNARFPWMAIFGLGLFGGGIDPLWNGVQAYWCYLEHRTVERRILYTTLLSLVGFLIVPGTVWMVWGLIRHLRYNPNSVSLDERLRLADEVSLKQIELEKATSIQESSNSAITVRGE